MAALQNLTIETEELGPGRGRFVAHAPGETDAAEMTFSRLADGTFLIDHTYTPDTWRGRGVARALFDHAIKEARAAGAKIASRCSYVDAEFARRPELAALIA